MLPFRQRFLHHSRFHFINSRFITPASISTTFFSSLSVPILQHYFHHSRFHFGNILFINPASISATFFSSPPLPFQQHSFIAPALGLFIFEAFFHHSSRFLFNRSRLLEKFVLQKACLFFVKFRIQKYQ